jgi:hypothetical protein
VDTTPFGSPARKAPGPAAPAAPSTPPGAAGRSWMRSPRVLGCAGLGVLVLAGAAVVLTQGDAPAPVVALPVPTATSTPTASATASVVPALSAGRNPFFALAGATTDATGSEAAAGTGTAAGTGAGVVASGGTSSAASTSQVVTVQGPVVTVPAPAVTVPGPAVTVPAPTVTVPGPQRTVEAPAALTLTYNGPTGPGLGTFTLTDGRTPTTVTVGAADVLGTDAPGAWIAVVGTPGADAAVVSVGARQYRLPTGVAVPLY